MSEARSAFWEDHDAQLADPEYARAFAAESVRVATIDSIMNTITAELEESGLSKAALARAIGAQPAVVRRLLSAESVNPTLGTLAEIAGALGMKVTLQPMTPHERATITAPMLAPEKTARAPR
jgi:DNA-binding phage protein